MFEENHPRPTREWLMRQFFKRLNRVMLWPWRLGLAPYLNFWPSGVGQFVVLTHQGRKSGRYYRTPVNYAEVDGDIYVTAGYGKAADWYRNIMAKPQIELWLANGRWTAEAEDVTDSQQAVTLMREVLKGSGFAAYLAGLHPLRMSDQTLSTATADYRLLRIKRIAPMVDSGGLGDLVWLWPLLVGVAFMIGRLWPRRQRPGK